MAAAFGQVSEPGAPGLGSVFQRHCTSPVSGSRASRYPGTSMASPPTPTITWFFTIMAAMVVKYCSFSSATFLRQRSLPSLALSEMNQPSGARKYSQS